ncbi:MAG: N-acetylmuramoyl-L-alanine amidase [Pseudomonadota bacterium]|jgi:N-acetylmuramoyl-L-alanine amidase
MNGTGIIEAPSPNFDARRSAIDMLLLHYTGMPTGEEALARLRDSTAKVSAHYLIEEDGRVFRLVAEDKRAWHAGLACWAGETDINSRAIGIELVNPGHEWGLRAFPQAQMHSLGVLALGILMRHGIAKARVLGHSDVAPLRKQDPGELFDWAWLAARGIGLWPQDDFKTADHPHGIDQADAPQVRALQQGLARYGYDIETHGRYDARTQGVVAAFQRHFRPARVDGQADAQTLARLASLLARL